MQFDKGVGVPLADVDYFPGCRVLRKSIHGGETIGHLAVVKGNTAVIVVPDGPYNAKTMRVPMVQLYFLVRDADGEVVQQNAKWAIRKEVSDSVLDTWLKKASAQPEDAPVGTIEDSEEAL